MEIGFLLEWRVELNALTSRDRLQLGLKGSLNEYELDLLRHGAHRSNLQPFLAIETTELLMVQDKFLTVHQHKQAAIAEAPANRCKLAQPLPHSLTCIS
jgi:hypothetical protein